MYANGSWHRFLGQTNQISQLHYKSFTLGSARAYESKTARYNKDDGFMYKVKEQYTVPVCGAIKQNKSEVEKCDFCLFGLLFRLEFGENPTEIG